MLLALHERERDLRTHEWARTRARGRTVRVVERDHEDAAVFWRSLRTVKALREDEAELLGRVSAALFAGCAPADRRLLLRVDAAEALGRVRSRGRRCESGMTGRYMESLVAEHESAASRGGWDVVQASSPAATAAAIAAAAGLSRRAP